MTSTKTSPIDVDESREIFTIDVYKACALYIYAHYTLDLSISKADTSAPGGKVELASAQHAFPMSRYLTGTDPTATPPAPAAQALIDPDPTTFDVYVGEWREFRFRSYVTRYLNDHLGVLAYGGEDFHFVALSTGAATPAKSVEEACEENQQTTVQWRRAINQPLWIGACKPGEATISLRHETDAVPPLYTYEFSTLGGDGNSAPEFATEMDTRTVPENTMAGVDIGLPVMATDPDTGDMLTYILGGPDAASFGIAASSGQLLTEAPLDHETQDSYSVTVSVHDGKDADGNFSTAIDGMIAVTITVENLDDLGKATISLAQPYVGAPLTARLTDPDGGVAGVAWRWESSSDGSTGWAAIGGARSASYTPIEGDLNRYLRVTASYTDEQGRTRALMQYRPTLCRRLLLLRHRSRSRRTGRLRSWMGPGRPGR